MTYRAQSVDTAKVLPLPRGTVVTALALLSWGIVVAAWKAITATIGFLPGA